MKTKTRTKGTTNTAKNMRIEKAASRAKPLVTESSGNVFRDLGLPQPERELTKARLTLKIHRIIRARNLTQRQAAEVLGIQQPQVSLLMRNRAGSFSVDRLMDFLRALGQDVEINVRDSSKEHGALSVNVG